MTLGYICLWSSMCIMLVRIAIGLQPIDVFDIILIGVNCFAVLYTELELDKYKIRYREFRDRNLLNKDYIKFLETEIIDFERLSR